MKIQYLHILPEFNCSMKFFCKNREIFFLNSHGSLQNEIDLKFVDGEEFELKVFPYNKKHERENIAYSAKLYFDGDMLFCDSRQVEIYKLPESHFYIKLHAASVGAANFSEYNKIESLQDKIKTLKILPTLTKKAEVAIYDIKGDLPFLTEKYYVNLEKEKTTQNLEVLKLVEFFENLKYQEYEKLKDNFTVILSDKLSNEKIINFFGEFEDIKVVNFYEQPAIILFYKNRKARVFSATFNRMMIDNIFEIE